MCLTGRELDPSATAYLGWTLSPGRLNTSQAFAAQPSRPRSIQTSLDTLRRSEIMLGFGPSLPCRVGVAKRHDWPEGTE
jgi:hypothetical protein